MSEKNIAAQSMFQTPAVQSFMAANEADLTPRFLRLRLVRWLWLLFGLLAGVGISVWWLCFQAGGG